MEDSNIENTAINPSIIMHDNFRQPADHSISCSSDSTIIKLQQRQEFVIEDDLKLERGDEADLKRLLVPDVGDLLLVPPSTIDSNFVSYFTPRFIFFPFPSFSLPPPPASSLRPTPPPPTSPSQIRLHCRCSTLPRLRLACGKIEVERQCLQKPWLQGYSSRGFWGKIEVGFGENEVGLAAPFHDLLPLTTNCSVPSHCCHHSPVSGAPISNLSVHM